MLAPWIAAGLVALGAVVAALLVACGLVARARLTDAARRDRERAAEERERAEGMVTAAQAALLHAESLSRGLARLAGFSGRGAR